MAGLWIELFIGLVKVFATKLLSNKGTTFQASLSVLHYQEWSKWAWTSNLHTVSGKYILIFDYPISSLLF